MSKILTPSQRSPGLALLDASFTQESLVRCESVPRKSRFPLIDTSFCEPGHNTWAASFGDFGLRTS
jgi:hypothetical protein